ncbi:MAG TPA: enoyl-CoA hydratase family protein [Acidobacteriota bacterium]|jgi:enoyl-CoA hydratase/carnithine racemase
MKQPKSFDFQLQNNIAQITLNRPEVFNAVTFDVYREMTDLFAELSSDNEVRVVTITGKGKAFCSGGDVRDIIGPLLERGESELRKFTQLTCDLVWNMRMLPVPIIASLNGVTAGAGAMIAIASDFRLASDFAKIAFLFVRVGLSGADMGACYILPKIVGLTKAAELLMTGDFITAGEAYRIGLYNKVFPPEQLEQATLTLAQQLSEGPATGLAVTKKQINEESLPGLKDALEAEATVQAHCMLHPDFREGFTAFTEKRKPSFQKRRDSMESK